MTNAMASIHDLVRYDNRTERTVFVPAPPAEFPTPLGSQKLIVTSGPRTPIAFRREALDGLVTASPRRGPHWPKLGSEGPPHVFARS